MTALTLLTLSVLTGAPAMSSQLFSLNITQRECQARALRTFATLHFANVRTEGASIIGSSKDQSAAIACIQTLDEVSVNVTTAGPTASSLLVTIEGQLRAVDLKGDAPFTGVWESSQWGFIILEQNGDQVRGSYTCCGSGTLSGKVTNNSVRLTWAANGSSLSVGETAMRVMKNGDLDGSWCSGKGCQPKEDHPFVGTRVK